MHGFQPSKKVCEMMSISGGGLKVIFSLSCGLVRQSGVYERRKLTSCMSRTGKFYISLIHFNKYPFSFAPSLSFPGPVTEIIQKKHRKEILSKSYFFFMVLVYIIDQLLLNREVVICTFGCVLYNYFPSYKKRKPCTFQFYGFCSVS